MELSIITLQSLIKRHTTLLQQLKSTSPNKLGKIQQLRIEINNLESSIKSKIKALKEKALSRIVEVKYSVNNKDIHFARFTNISNEEVEFILNNLYGNNNVKILEIKEIPVFYTDHKL